ncbi:hypothetical protein [Bacillus albus]|uniref:hypothetical protein n=1 Tax=Bacillus albus TaxID=2026189 RepID=UPI001021E88A|nr:hypothetical protein [Bacillus albus]
MFDLTNMNRTVFLKRVIALTHTEISEETSPHYDSIKEKGFTSIKEQTEYINKFNVKSGLYTGRMRKVDPQTVDITNISIQFSRINNEEDMLEFANKFGLLGVTALSKSGEYLRDFTECEIDIDDEEGKLTLNPYIDFEPLIIWEHEIENVRNILKLYKGIYTYLEKGIDNITDNILFTSDFFPGSKAFHWKSNSKFIHVYPDDIDILAISLAIIKKTFEEYLVGISLGMADLFITRQPQTLKFTEKKECNHLITAIYYDLWSKITIQKEIGICLNSNCTRPFIKNKRQTYCSNSCKQEAYRIRKKRK